MNANEREMDLDGTQCYYLNGKPSNIWIYYDENIKPLCKIYHIL